MDLDELKLLFIRQEEMIAQLISMVANLNQKLDSNKISLELKMDELKSDFRQVRRRTFAIETDLDETINRVDRIEPRQ